MTSPPIPGPTIREALKMLELSAIALGSSARPTISMVNACRAGVSKTSTVPYAAASRSTSHTVAMWVSARTLSTAASTIEVACVPIRVRRTSSRSMTAPPSSPSTAKGPNWQAARMPTAAAEWVSWSTNQAWATFCTQVPLIEIPCPMK